MYIEETKSQILKIPMAYNIGATNFRCTWFLI